MQSSVGQLCSAIVDRLIRGESICEDEVFDDVSCVNDAVQQLFDVLVVDHDVATVIKLRTLISDHLSIDHHRSVREEDDDSRDGEHQHDRDEEQATQNVNMCVAMYVAIHVQCMCINYTSSYVFNSIHALINKNSMGQQSAVIIQRILIVASSNEL